MGRSVRGAERRLGAECGSAAGCRRKRDGGRRRRDGGIGGSRFRPAKCPLWLLGPPSTVVSRKGPQVKGFCEGVDFELRWFFPPFKPKLSKTPLLANWGPASKFAQRSPRLRAGEPYVFALGTHLPHWQNLLLHARSLATLRSQVPPSRAGRWWRIPLWPSLCPMVRAFGHIRPNMYLLELPNAADGFKRTKKHQPASTPLNGTHFFF